MNPQPGWAVFFRRFIGAMALDAGVFEEVEADRRAGVQAVLVVTLACIAAGVAAMNMNAMGARGFAAGLVAMVGAWIVWLTVLSAMGSRLLPEPQTRSDPGELQRTLGFATAPGVLLAFAAMPVIAPGVFALVSIWMIAASVLAVRQALDYRGVGRAVVVCVLAWLMSFGLVAALGLLFVTPVS